VIPKLRRRLAGLLGTSLFRRSFEGKMPWRKDERMGATPKMPAALNIIIYMVSVSNLGRNFGDLKFQ
jgi:hypothetical protein